MKKYFSVLALGLGILALASCNSNGTTAETTSSEGTGTTTTTDVNDPTAVVEYEARFSKGTVNAETGLPDDIQDGNILHAWNWSYNTIKENMATIARCGYTAVQTSPIQQSKSTVKNGAWSSDWYMLYQPVSFSIAADSYLGTKEEFAEMCQEAENYGVKVVVDIVVNHLGNDTTGHGYSERIEEYEPEIYNNRSTYFHNSNQNVSDTNATTVTQYMLSDLPDLNTGNDYVQSRVISLLKECIDCGADGFRFDAAKHIETPDDGTVASNFWPNVLSAATEYAKTKNNENLFYYGEILNTPGGGRSYDSYTKYMSITDSNYSTNLLNKLGAGMKKTIKNNFNYSFSNDGTKAVVWPESHDTYADKTTMSTQQERLNRLYAFEASRGGASTLYFARPSAITAMGEMGSKAWKSAEVAAVNGFSNAMVGENETVSFQPEFLMVERGNKGAVVISATAVREEKEIEIKAFAIADGTYIDQVTGRTVTVANGLIKGTISTTGIMVLMDKTPLLYPEFALSSEIGFFYDTFDVTVTPKNYTEATYKINDGEAVALTEATTITLTPNSEGVATLTLYASNNGNVTEETYTYKQVEKRDGYVAIGGLRDTVSNKYLAWVWWKGKAGHWEEVVLAGDVAYVAIPKVDGVETIKNAMYLIAAFPKDYDVESLYGTTQDVWADKTGQTVDYTMQYDVVEMSNV